MEADGDKDQDEDPQGADDRADDDEQETQVRVALTPRDIALFVHSRSVTVASDRYGRGRAIALQFGR